MAQTLVEAVNQDRLRNDPEQTNQQFAEIMKYNEMKGRPSSTERIGETRSKWKNLLNFGKDAASVTSNAAARSAGSTLRKTSGLIGFLFSALTDSQMSRGAGGWGSLHDRPDSEWGKHIRDGLQTQTPEQLNEMPSPSTEALPQLENLQNSDGAPQISDEALKAWQTILAAGSIPEHEQPVFGERTKHDRERVP